MNSPDNKGRKDFLGELTQSLANTYANEMNRQIFSDNIMPIFDKPVRYYTVPRFTIRIPYFVWGTEYDSEYGEGRKGLFLEWKEIRIGSKKELNTNYKEEMKRWKKLPKTIKFSRYTGTKHL